MDASQIGKRAWSYAGVLQQAGLSCVEYVEQIRVTARSVAAATDALELRPDRDALLAAFRNFTRATES